MAKVWEGWGQLDIRARMIPMAFFSRAVMTRAFSKLLPSAKVMKPVLKPQTNSSLVAPSSLTARMRGWRLASLPKSDSLRLSS